MNFDITSTLFGLSIRGEGKEYHFKTKIFSHSSKLIDNNSKVVVTIIRKSWWNMDFDMDVLNQKYQLHQNGFNGSDAKLISYDPDVLFVESGSGFFCNSSQVTELKTIGLRSNKFTLTIKDEDHHLALLSATCLGLSWVSINA